MMRAFHVVLLCATVLAAVACGGGEPQQARPSSPVEVSIVEPKVGAVITDDTFQVKVELAGGKIVKETTRDLTPTTEGHLHVSVDGAILSQTYGLTQSLKSPDPGKHLLQVEFVAKDHGPFAPRIIESAPFEVKR
jgi:hypothetical protein